MHRKKIKPEEKVPIKIVPRDRRLILEKVVTLDPTCERILRTTPVGEPILMTLDDWSDLADSLAAEANHAADPHMEHRFGSVFEKIDAIIDKYDDTEEPEMDSGIAKARPKLSPVLPDTIKGKNPGMVPSKVESTAKNAAKQGGTYPIRLTDKQRWALIHVTRLPARIKTRLKELAAGPQVLSCTHKELNQLHDELSQAVVVTPSPEKKQLAAVQKKVFELLDSALHKFGEPDLRNRLATKSSGIYQFRVTLLHTRPAIWRRIQVTDRTLGTLHDYIQAAFGWWNYHLHRFTIDGIDYGPPPPDELVSDFEWKDDTKVKISKLVPKSGRRTRWIYEYDFGDGWVHEILFEGFPPADKKVKYPICLEGDRACPPEDIGGPFGFEGYLAAITNPKHEEHQEYLEWRGPYDPDAFDAKKATREMRKL